MILGMNDELPFGTASKYHGMTVQEILWDDEGRAYLRWALEKKDISFTEEVEDEL